MLWDINLWRSEADEFKLILWVLGRLLSCQSCLCPLKTLTVTFKAYHVACESVAFPVLAPLQMKTIFFGRWERGGADGE